MKLFITGHPDIKDFVKNFTASFNNFAAFLKQEQLTNIESVYISKEETLLSDDVFKRIKTILLIDKYEAYQILNDEWTKISVDLEIVKTEGFKSTKKVDPDMVLKKKKGKD